MKFKYCAVLLFILLLPVSAFTDKLTLADGATLEGIVQKMEKGQVTVKVGQETKVLDILSVQACPAGITSTPNAVETLVLLTMKSRRVSVALIGKLRSK